MTFPKMCFFVRSLINSSNLILKTMEMISVRSCGFKLYFPSSLVISGHFGLHVNVMKMSGNPTTLDIAIPSKYNWSIYLLLPTKVEGKMTLFPWITFSPWLLVLAESVSCLYLPTLNLDWFFLNQLSLSASIIAYPSTKNYCNSFLEHRNVIASYFLDCNLNENHFLIVNLFFSVTTVSFLYRSKIPGR